MRTLADVADVLKTARHKAGLSQQVLADSAGVSRVTLARMEAGSQGDMSVSSLMKLLSAAGYELRAAKRGHVRTLDDILAEQRNPGDRTRP